MNKQQKISLGLMIVGTNLVTAITMALIAQKALTDQHERLHKTVKSLKIYHDALEKYAANAPAEISRPIVEELAFEWVVRDLV